MAPYRSLLRLLRRKPPRPQAVLIAVTFLWGSTFAVSKDLLAGAPPLLYLSSRFVLGALVMAAFCRGGRARLLRGPLGDALVLGLLQGGGLLLQVLGQCYTTASKSAFLTALSVPLVPLCGLLLRGERPRAEQAAALCVGAGGLLLLTYPPGGVRWNLGDLLTIACALVYAVAIVETSHRARRHDALGLATAQTVVCAALFTASWLLVNNLPRGWLGELARQETRPLLLSGRLIAEGLYMALLCTALTFSAQTWAMGRMSATQSAVIFALEPVFATAIALVAFGATEWPGTRGAVGAGLVLCAVLGSEVRLPPHRE